MRANVPARTPAELSGKETVRPLRGPEKPYLAVLDGDSHPDARDT